MTWEIVIGIITLFGFLGSIVKWVVPLTESIVRLTDKVQMLCDKFSAFDKDSAEEHEKLWAHNKTQDEKLDDHAKRLHELDGKW